MRFRLCRRLTEREIKCLHARIEKLNRDLSLSNRLRLPNELIHPRFGNDAIALGIYVTTVSGPWRLSIDEYAKPRGSSSHRWTHDEIDVASVKAIDNASICSRQHDGIFLRIVQLFAKRPRIES